ncbi:MAG: hypothetical protein D6743_16290, partial [Calditrichaeota bacterium]
MDLLVEFAFLFRVGEDSAKHVLRQCNLTHPARQKESYEWLKRFPDSIGAFAVFPLKFCTSIAKLPKVWDQQLHDPIPPSNQTEGKIMKRVGLTLWGLGFFLIVGLVLMSPRFARGQAKVTHGPVVGAVTDTGARILVRTDTVATVQFQLATDTTFANPVLSTTATAVADSDFFVIVDVTGLQSATRYFYRPVLDGTPQNDIGEFVTFPPPGSETTFTFAFGSCQQAFDDPNSNKGGVFPRIAEEYPWFFLHLGDWTYPDTTDTEQNPTNYFNVDYARVQASYRTKYARDFPMFELLRTTAIDYVYDDHDYSNDNSDMTYPGRENSIRGYHAMFPHYPLASPGNGLWHKFTYANCDFFFLDTRSQRHPN